MNRTAAAQIALANEFCDEAKITPEQFSRDIFRYAFDHARVHGIHRDNDPTIIAARMAVLGPRVILQG